MSILFSAMADVSAAIVGDRLYVLSLLGFTSPWRACQVMRTIYRTLSPCCALTESPSQLGNPP